MRRQIVENSNELFVYRFGNGIKLIDANIEENYNPLGHSTTHLLSRMLELPFLIYLEDTQHNTVQCNVVNAKECGFNSVNDCIGAPWFEFFTAKSVAQSIKNDKEIVKNNVLKIVEEKMRRNDGVQLDTLSIRMPWYDNRNNIIGLFGCSIILGQNPLANSLSQIAKLGLLNAATNLPNLVTGAEINSIYFSKREIECLSRTVRGKTAKQIARDLEISPRTVEEYLTNIKIKMGVSSKSELIEKSIDFIL